MDDGPFVGREAELDELLDVPAEHRLVVLTGVRGSGRTALARQFAQMREARADRPVAWVEDIGVQEPPEVSLLRLLSGPALRPRVQERTPEPTGSGEGRLSLVVDACRRALSEEFGETLLIVDGARGPLLDALVSVAEGACGRVPAGAVRAARARCCGARSRPTRSPGTAHATSARGQAARL